MSAFGVRKGRLTGKIEVPDSRCRYMEYKVVHQFL